jgi:hypothetical protein
MPVGLAPPAAGDLAGPGMAPLAGIRPVRTFGTAQQAPHSCGGPHPTYVDLSISLGSLCL